MFLLKVGLDLQDSDSGKGLTDWMAGRSYIDDETFRGYVEEMLGKMDLGKLLHLDDKPFRELAGAYYGPDEFRFALPPWLHWFAVEGTVFVANEEITDSRKNRDQYNKEQAERERVFQMEMEELDRQEEKVKKKKVIQDLENELAKSKKRGNDIENQMRMTMLQKVYDDFRASQEGRPCLNTIEGEPFIADHLVLEINDVRLELETKRDVILGRTKSTADVSMVIPEGCIDEANRGALCRKISKKHVRLVHLGGAVQIMSMPRTSNDQNPTTMTSTYLGEEKVTLEGKMFTGDTDLGISSDVRWKCRVQKENDGGVEKISSLVLNYPACNDLYKIFVWPNCRLKTVDPRLPNWQIVYQTGTHGLEGAFYVTTATGKSIYLKLGQLIVEELGISITKE